MKYPIAIVATAMVAILVLLTGCQQPIPPVNRVPVIGNVVANPSTVAINGTVSLNADAIDADGDRLLYSWSASAGVFSSTSGAVVTWTAPATPSTIAITVGVSDGSNSIVSKSASVQVVIPNEAPSAFVANARAESASLSWVNPTSSFKSVVVRRDVVGYPTLPTEGTEVYQGTNTSFVDQGLQAGKSYYYSIWAKNTLDAYSERQTATAIPLVVDNQAPTDVSAVGAVSADSSVTLSWQPPTASDFDGVQITFTPVQAGINQPVLVPKGTSSYTVSGLVNSVTYSFTVRSKDLSDNLSFGTTIDKAPTSNMAIDPTDKTPPNSPTSFLAVAGNNGVALSWVQPTSPDYIYSEITFTPLQPDVAQPIIVTKGTVATTINQLFGNTVYSFSIKAVDTAGNRSSGVGASASPTDTTAPAAPSGLSSLNSGPNVTDGKIYLIWSEPSDFDYAYVRITSDGKTDFGSSMPATTVAKGTTALLYPPNANKLSGYDTTVTFVAYDSAGNASASVNLIKRPMDTTAPAVPTSLAWSKPATGATSADFSWTDPTTLDFANVKFTSSPSPTGYTGPISVAKGVQALHLDGLNPNTSYTFSLASVDLAGNSSGAVGIVNTGVTNLTATANNDGTVRLNWDTIASASGIGLAVTYRELPSGLLQTMAHAINGNGFSPGNLGTWSSGTWLSPVLNAGQKYEFGVSHSGGPRLLVEATGADLAPPVAPTAAKMVRDAGTAVLTWTDSTASDLASTLVDITPAPTTGSYPKTVTKGVGTLTVAGLDDAVAYTVTLKAVDMSGNQSTALSHAAPTNLLGTLATAPLASGDMTLTWTEPASPLFNQVEIAVSPVLASVSIPILVNAGTKTKTLTPLVPGANYTFRLRTVAANGTTSPWVSTSATSTVTNPLVGLSATKENSGNILLTWNEPNPAGFNQVELTFTPTVSSITQPILVNAGVKTKSVGVLDPGVSYTFSAKTVYANGNKSSAQTVTQTSTDIVAPAAVSMRTGVVLPSGTRALLNWSEPTSDFSSTEVSITPAPTGWTTQSVAKGAAMPYTVTGLSPGTSYTFSLKSVDPTGNKGIAATLALTAENQMVAVTGGTFTMGRSGGDADETPHSVTLSAFKASSVEVTENLWYAFYNTNTVQTTAAYRYMNWYDSITFANALSLKEGLNQVYWLDAGFTVPYVSGSAFVFVNSSATGYRLLTEAEWEYAATGGAGGQAANYTYSGSNTIGTVANQGGDYVVKLKTANQLGLYDMTGNSWEWVWDYYATFTAAAQTNPTGPSTGSTRQIRGGSWSDNLLVRDRWTGHDPSVIPGGGPNANSRGSTRLARN